MRGKKKKQEQNKWETMIIIKSNSKLISDNNEYKWKLFQVKINLKPNTEIRKQIKAHKIFNVKILRL